VKINERLVKFEAVLLLRKATGWRAERITKTLNELGFSISLNTVRHYLYHNELPELSPLIKSLFYHKAYELALKLKERNPKWNHKRISIEIKRKLGIRISPKTIYYWITRRGKPSIVPLKIHLELGYVIGALLSDCTRTTYVKLAVKDRDYAESFAHALDTVTGRKYRVKERDGYYIVRTRGSPLRYIVKSGLWKVVAYVYLKEFLQGLFDGDGSVTMRVSPRPEFIVRITLCDSNLELLEFTKRLLRKLGIESKILLNRKRGTKTTICGRECTINEDCWVLTINRQKDIIKFYKHVGFRIQRKQEKLRDVVEILRKYKSNRGRVRAWKKLYVKDKGGWIKRTPQTTPTFNFS